MNILPKKHFAKKYIIKIEIEDCEIFHADTLVRHELRAEYSASR